MKAESKVKFITGIPKMVYCWNKVLRLSISVWVQRLLEAHSLEIAVTNLVVVLSIYMMSMGKIKPTPKLLLGTVESTINCMRAP